MPTIVETPGDCITIEQLIPLVGLKVHVVVADAPYLSPKNASAHSVGTVEAIHWTALDANNHRAGDGNIRFVGGSFASWSTHRVITITVLP